MAVDGIGVAYVTAGFLLAYSGYRNQPIKTVLTDFLKGQVPPPGAAQNLSIGVSTVGNSSSPSSSSSPGGGGSGSSTSVSSGSNNYLTIGQYLMQNGYSRSGAAGIVGCVAGESGGNPEANSGSGIGLIQWTGSNESMVPPLTGNATRDLDAQLPAIIKYNNAQGSGLIRMLNSFPETASGAVQAADFYSEHFERPAVTDSDVRAGVAESVFSELGSAGGGSIRAVP